MRDRASDAPLRAHIRSAGRIQDERAKLTTALGTVAIGIEHIGSTAVPGLAAKPIIDVLVTVADIEDETRYLPALQQAGCVLRVREPGHRMVRTPGLDVHVHVLPDGDPACHGVPGLPQ